MRAGKGQEKEILLLLALPLIIKGISGKGATRA